MSHFTVLVIGPNVEEQLSPYEEKLKVEWVDQSEEYQKEYDTEETSEFYCGSCSSWGQEIDQDLFDFIKSNPVGAMKKVNVIKKSGLSYFKNKTKYRGYYTVDSGKRCEGDAWFEVTKVINTSHPDSDVCFEGDIQIRVIEAPKKLPLKTVYPEYSTYLEDYHGVTDTENLGYWKNPKAKWDWYLIGGRWTGMLKLKGGCVGIAGKPGLMTEKAEAGYCDQARKGDIDWDFMETENFEKYSKIYDEFEEKLKNDPRMDDFNPYFEYGIENKGNREVYIPETRKEYLDGRVQFSTFAVVKDGVWYEKGSMGWFGVSLNESETWKQDFNAILKSLPDEELITVVDCHI